MLPVFGRRCFLRETAAADEALPRTRPRITREMTLRPSTAVRDGETLGRVPNWNKRPSRVRCDQGKALAAPGPHAGRRETARGDHTVEDTVCREVNPVLLARVLFLVGLGTHFPFQSVRYGLLGLGAVLLVVSAVRLLTLPRLAS